MRPRLVRVALFGLFRFCHPLRHDVLCSTWMGPGDRRYELRWIPSSPRSKGKPSSRILKMDFACLPPHPPRQGKAKFPDITLGLVLNGGVAGHSCSFRGTDVARWRHSLFERYCKPGRHLPRRHVVGCFDLSHCSRVVRATAILFCWFCFCNLDDRCVLV